MSRIKVSSTEYLVSSINSVGFHNSEILNVCSKSNNF